MVKSVESEMCVDRWISLIINVCRQLISKSRLMQLCYHRSLLRDELDSGDPISPYILVPLLCRRSVVYAEKL